MRLNQTSRRPAPPLELKTKKSSTPADPVREAFARLQRHSEELLENRKRLVLKGEIDAKTFNGVTNEVILRHLNQWAKNQGLDSRLVVPAFDAGLAATSGKKRVRIQWPSQKARHAENIKAIANLKRKAGLDKPKAQPATPKEHPWASDLKKKKKWQAVRRKPWLTTWRFGDDVTEPIPFANIPHQVLRSKTFKDLTDTDYRLLMYAIAQFTGRNNGEITLTPEQVKRDLGWSRARFSRSCKRLLNARALERVMQAVGVLPALYKITFIENAPKKGDPDDD